MEKFKLFLIVLVLGCTCTFFISRKIHDDAECGALERATEILGAVSLVLALVGSGVLVFSIGISLLPD